MHASDKKAMVTLCPQKLWEKEILEIIPLHIVIRNYENHHIGHKPRLSKRVGIKDLSPLINLKKKLIR